MNKNKIVNFFSGFLVGVLFLYIFLTINNNHKSKCAITYTYTEFQTNYSEANNNEKSNTIAVNSSNEQILETSNNKTSIDNGIITETTTIINTITENPLEECPSIPPGLVGKINYTQIPIPTVEELNSELSWLQKGGHYAPTCRKNQTLAVIVPYRNRTDQLPLFLKYMHPYFKKQQLNYTVFIVEQADNLAFNRGELMNVGFVEALKIHDFSCFVFHDVDLFPDDDRNLYVCDEIPKHMISGVNKRNYTMHYWEYVGGVFMISKKAYEKVNGFPNRYWGWGSEDDDFGLRLHFHNYTFDRPAPVIGYYTMLKHDHEPVNPLRMNLINSSAKYFLKDGLNSLDYTIESIDKLLLYTRILVTLHPNMIF